MIKRRSKTDTLMKFTKKATELFGTNHITRDQAVSVDLKFYWTGKPCLRGHLTFRYVDNRACRQCILDGLEFKTYGDVHVGLEIKNSIDDIEHRLELKRLEKEYDYDI